MQVEEVYVLNSKREKNHEMQSPLLFRGTAKDLFPHMVDEANKY